MERIKSIVTWVLLGAAYASMGLAIVIAIAAS